MDKYRLEIERSLKLLSFEKQLTFCALTCEKLYPNYLHFSEMYSWGKSGTLQNAISVIFQSIFDSDLFSDDELSSTIEEIELITPDTEDFDTIKVSFALDACTSVLSTLYFMQNRDIENVVDVATYARDTVHMFIQERDDLDYNDPLFDNEIENDKLMKQEKERQIEVIKYLVKVNTVNDSIFEELRHIQPLEIVDLSVVS